MITLLDLGGVVFQSTGESNELIDWSTISELNNIYGHDLNIGLDQFPNFLKDYNLKTGLNLAGKEFLKSVFDTLEFNAELIEGIRKHSEIIIVSDNYRENIAYISKRFKFSEWAIKTFYSFDFGLEKSNPAFFEKLLGELEGFKVEDMIFIDDSLSKLKSAQKSGIKGIHFQNTKQALGAFLSSAMGMKG